MGRSFLVVDPFHEYAIRFIELAARRYGYRPLAVITSDPPSGWRASAPMSTLRVAPADLRRAGQALRGAGVVGAIPYAQTVMRSTTELLRGLESKWNEPEVLATLDDKFAVKQRIRQRRPKLQVGVSHRVKPGCLQGLEIPERFVIKPTHGYGNRAVGFFTAATPTAVVDQFMLASGEEEFVLEEYLPGPEFIIDGQVDGSGEATVVAIFEYERVEANGHRVDWLTKKTAHSSQEFRVLAEFAQHVLRAVGLRRSPFHLEAKLFRGEPALVEINPRLAGNQHALLCGSLHGNETDLFAVAADHYLHEDACSRPFLDWDRYDREEVLYVHGVQHRRGILHTLAGAREVEAHPLFRSWARAPALAQALRPTVDLFTSPWCFVLRGRQSIHTLVAESARLRSSMDLCARRWGLRALILQGRRSIPRLPARLVLKVRRSTLAASLLRLGS